ncbi:MAG TPA: catalase family peroxidase [Methylomirabilota bacterium]|jgi:catalase|nr:catalase family peroxidase [Methylomirabilota bacterium]
MPESAGVAAQIVEVMRQLAGKHPGFRPVHAKGLLCAGTFRPSPEARRVTRAAHFQDSPVAVVVRFANASGNPAIGDGTPGVRSMSVKFRLPAGKDADVLANSVEGFVARTPEETLEFFRAQLTPETFPKYLESHPAARDFVARLGPRAIPASYARASYHAEHAFRFTAADGTRRFGRYHFIPEAGEAYLSPDEAGKLGADFLRDEFERRLKAAPAVFRLVLQLAEAGDPTNDPTALWPAARPTVALGRLEITAISPTGAADERRLVFDPVNLTDGIDLSDDPVLLVRSAAYSISYNQRTTG